MTLQVLICENPSKPKTFRVALDGGYRFTNLCDIETDTLGDAIGRAKRILSNLPELKNSAWAGEFKTSFANVLNPRLEPTRWVIDFSPAVPDEVNAILLTTVGKADGF